MGVKSRSSGNSRQQDKRRSNRHIINLPAVGTRVFTHMGKAFPVCGYGLDSLLVPGYRRGAFSRVLRISRFRLRK